MTYRKKLIEMALPLEAINIASATVTITKNEITTALNKPENFILAIIPIEEGRAADPRYVRKPFVREPDLGVTSVNYDLGELLSRAEIIG